ncbi:MAG: LysR family transcriptional regulator, partial [Pseudolabrys sp.]
MALQNSCSYGNYCTTTVQIYPAFGMPDFDWNDIRFFLAVVRAGTLTLAARRLRTDHTSVGRRLTGL